MYCSVESLQLGCAYNCVDTKAKSRATTKNGQNRKEIQRKPSDFLSKLPVV